MSCFSIAGLQLALEPEHNLEVIGAEVTAALRTYPWIQMVVLGELSSFGPNTTHAQALPGPAESFYCELAKQLGIWLLPGSLFEKTRDKVYNTCSVINPAGEVVDRYRKIFPFYPYEKGVAAGDKFVVFDVPEFGRIGVCICYDEWFPEVSRTLAWLGAEVILCPNMTNTIDRELELSIARVNAVVNQCYFFNINCAGKLGNGRSIVIDPEGTILHQAGSGREIIPISVDPALVHRVRERGVLNLGQTLKSFRDCNTEFPPYLKTSRQSALLNRLGPLVVPERDS